MLSPAAWLRSIVMVLSPSEFERKGLGHSRGISPLSGGPLLIGRLIHQKQHCNRVQNESALAAILFCVATGKMKKGPSDRTSNTMDNTDRTPDKTTGVQSLFWHPSTKQMGLDSCPLHTLYGTLRNDLRNKPWFQEMITSYKKRCNTKEFAAFR